MIVTEEIEWFVDRLDGPRLMSFGGYSSVYRVLGDKDTGHLVIATEAEPHERGPSLTCLNMARVEAFFAELLRRGDPEDGFDQLYYEEDFFGEDT